MAEWERTRSKPPRAVGRPGARAGGPPEAPSRVWLFGLHAVRDALLNPRRVRRRLILTRNAADRLGEAVAQGGLEPEIADARRFPAPLDPGSVHQGAALEADPLDWGALETLCAPRAGAAAPTVVLLDRVTDPHNVGAVLRTAEVFGAVAVIAPRRHAAPETGALAKAASGALERQPYLRVGNLAQAMADLRALGYRLVGLDGAAEATIGEAAADAAQAPLGLALGAEGPGLRQLTRETCDALARIPAQGGFRSLNVSNAAAIALYAAALRHPAR
ncbi:MAG: 23S rRNA (guanosine(2251)-2'-O)-methyltransferase RlmB [Rhodobacteraceae bacterium]|nr:MAG: 23S rRNA (guanosine(2251)-2'-O)-methyltransferase RlmB [Paracoccaceae bacterium]